MKKKSIITTVIACVLLVAVIAAALNAVFTVTYVRASFRTYTARGAAAAEEMKEKLNGYINSSSVFLDLSDVRATVEKDPRFEVVSVAKEYPETIVVEVRERREAFAVAAAEGGYTILGEDGRALGSADSAEGYILLEEMGISYENGFAVGERFAEFLKIYGALKSVLGETRANVVSARYDSPASDVVRCCLQMKEGCAVWLYTAAGRTEELAAAAAKAYLGMEDAQRIFCDVSAVIDGSGAVSVTVRPKSA